MEGNGDTYIDDDEWRDADLVAGFSPISPALKRNQDDGHTLSANGKAPVQTLDELDWSAWETPRGPTPVPGSEAQRGSEFNDDFLAAFGKMSMAQQRQSQQKPSPPMIDLREMEKKLDGRRKIEQPAGGELQAADLDFFESFNQDPRAVMANSRGNSYERSKLKGDQLSSMHEAQASPMMIISAQAGGRPENEYFGGETEVSASPQRSPTDEQAPASPSGKRQGGKGSWTESAGGWAGSVRRTLGTIRGHLPTARDFYVSDDEEDGETKNETDDRFVSSSKHDAVHGHPRKLANLANYSQSTPFSSNSDARSPPHHFSPPGRDPVAASTFVHPVAGHHSNAPISGAPGFDPSSGRNWNTGSWSLSSKEEAERRRRPIPVVLKGRREETQDVVDADLAAALTAHLPKRHQLGKAWKLLYSSDQHGISIGTLYHKVETGLDLRKQGARPSSGAAASLGGVQDAEGWLRGASETTRAALTGVQRVGGGVNLSEAGLILAIKDDDENVFGAFVNERIRPQTGYYGNGECFLWKQTDSGKLKAFNWTGRNDYMVLTEAHYLSFGGGEGKYGLWVDGRLEHGISSSCPAFDNEVLCDGRDNSGSQSQPAEGRFECITLEVWACGID